MRFLNFGSRFILSVFCLSLVAMTGCKPKTKSYKSPPHYNFGGQVLTVKFPEEKLVEISGIAWDAKNNNFLAVCDEAGSLYVIDRDNKVINEEHVFGSAGDYEDIALYFGVPYILRSDGVITKFVKDSTNKVLGVEVGDINLDGTNDFEAMYADQARKALIILCKNCAKDNDNSISAYAYYPDSIGFDHKPVFTIDAKKIAELSPKSTDKFQPSAAAIHPILQKLFILSSASHEMAVTDLDGRVEAVYRLSPKMFPQPEGLTFRNGGDMIITNEGLPRKRKATILTFNYIAVSDSSKNIINQTGYDFSNPDASMTLNKHLKEISGMAYVPSMDKILAENDEKGNIFMVDFKEKNDLVKKIPFGGKDDYEDIVYTDSAIYMLVATGKIIKVFADLNSGDTSAPRTEEYVLPKEGTNEFETMYLEPDGKSLIMLCKECDHEKNKIRVAHRFNLQTKKFDPEPAYTLQISVIQQILNDPKAEFKPSAGGINPKNGKLYLVASVGKIIVVCDQKGKVESVTRIDPVLFNQPEGITFAPNGDMYISNEAAEAVARILKFIYKKQ